MQAASHSSPSPVVSSMLNVHRKYLTRIGDLGVEASRVEKELVQKFHLAQRWNCVLLLDEADVFLTQRTRSDINHNSLVSGQHLRHERLCMLLTNEKYSLEC